MKQKQVFRLFLLLFDNAFLCIKRNCLAVALLGILGDGVPPGSSNPDPLRPLQTKKCHFPQPFSHQTSKIHTRFQT